MSKKSTLDFEKEHVKRIDGYARRVEGIYMKAADKAVMMTESIKVDPKVPFSFAKYPELRARADKLIDEVFKSTASIITQANETEWLEACKKNDSLVDQFSGVLTPEQIKTYKGRNLEALKAFQGRKVNGLGLSDRVWNYSKQFKGDIEMALDIGLGDGRSAADLSRDVRKYLKEPEKLFRRVRDKHGVLQLSKNAKKYSPGPGVYRSSYKNAMRLTRTETNMAYRTSDYESNQQLDFVVGIEIKRSNHVFACPICEQLKGRYPKTFKFVGFHPQCRCYQVSILATQEEFIKQQKEILAGNDSASIQSVNEVKDMPKQFTNWMMDNNDRIQNAKTLPYFIRDNKTLMNMVGANEGVFGVGAKYTNIDDVMKNIDIQELQKRDNQVNSGRTYQGYLGEMQGYNGLPKLVNNEAFNNLSKDDNYVQIFRGFRQGGDELTDSFKHGKLYEGLGAYGDGSYFGTRESVALSYTTDNNRNHVISAMFDRRAVKIADYDELKDAWYAERDTELGNFSAAAKRHFNVEKLSQIDPDLLDVFEITQKAVYGNFGSWCTCRGYDMIYIKSEEFFVMLNRTKLIVRE
jgi:hypothetical protein